MALLILPPISNLDWKPLIELRARFERRSDRDFARSRIDNVSDLLTRTRVGVEGKAKDLKVQLQMQVANDEHWEQAGNRMIERRDLRLALVETKVAGFTVTAGRQGVKKGLGRLITEFDWNNVGCAYDALRVTNKQWDFMAGQVAFSPSLNWETRMTYAAYTSKLGETMFVGKFSPGGDEVYTLDHVAKIKSGAWTTDAELAIQTGNRDGKDLTAAAGYAKATTPLTPKVDLGLTASFATGGGGPTSSHTFDQILGAYRGPNGISLVYGWRNIQFAGIGATYKPAKDQSVCFNYYRFGLFDRKDAFYTAQGTRARGVNGVLQDATGNSGKDLGEEFSVDAKWMATKNTTYMAGFALVKPGGFVRALNGETTRDQMYGYVMASFRL